MRTTRLRLVGLLLLSASCWGRLALAQDETSPSDIPSLRRELAELRQEYNARLGGCGAPCGCQGCAAPCDAQAGCSSTGCGCGTCGCFEPCCHPSGIWASAELLFLRYHRADGAREGTLANEATEFNFETSPRFTLGWVGCDGLGVRVRYWEYDHTAPAAGPDPAPPPPPTDEGTFSLHVDTYTLDFEVFDTFCLNRNWNLEVAAGIRYNEFFERMTDPDNGLVEFGVNSFHGFGIVTGAELRRAIGDSGSLWARVRGSILMDDKDVSSGVIRDGVAVASQQVRLTDVVVGTLELALGYDYIVPRCDGSYYFARVQAECQTWYNYSSAFADTDDNNNEGFAGPSDVGFGGFGIAVGLIR